MWRCICVTARVVIAAAGRSTPSCAQFALRAWRRQPAQLWLDPCMPLSCSRHAACLTLTGGSSWWPLHSSWCKLAALELRRAPAWPARCLRPCCQGCRPHGTCTTLARRWAAQAAPLRSRACCRMLELENGMAKRCSKGSKRGACGPRARDARSLRCRGAWWRCIQSWAAGTTSTPCGWWCGSRSSWQQTQPTSCVASWPCGCVHPPRRNGALAAEAANATVGAAAGTAASRLVA